MNRTTKRKLRPGCELLEARELLSNSSVYVEETDHNLWLETPGWQANNSRTFIDSSVLAFAPVGNGNVFVEGEDHNLWLEAPGWQANNSRTLIDYGVLAFAPFGNGNALVEGDDSNLWLEAPDWQANNSRTLIDSHVYAFSTAGNGQVFVQGYNGNLWLEAPGWQASNSRTLMDANVLAFAPGGGEQALVEGTDDKLWFETPGWQAHNSRTFIDYSVLAFASVGNGNFLVEGINQNLWLEHLGWQSNNSRILWDTTAQSFSSLGNGTFYVQGDDGNLWLEPPGWSGGSGRTFIDSSVLAMAPASADPIGVGFAEVGTYVGPNTAATTGISAWSGYAAQTSLTSPQQNSVSYVSGSWVVPKVSPSSSGSSYSSVWVGIDGNGNDTVEQIGTEEDYVNMPLLSTPVYYAWWEMYSTGDKQPQQVISSMTVNPGDLITASVQSGPGPGGSAFILSINDESRANDSYGVLASTGATQSPLAQRSTAEWIVEDTSVNNSTPTLARFAPVYFSNAQVVINGVFGTINSPSWTSEAENIVSSSGATLDTTTALANMGSSFVVSYGTPGTAASVVVRSGPGAAAGTRLGTTAGASVSLLQRAQGPVLTRPAAPDDGDSPSGMIRSARYSLGSPATDAVTARPANLLLGSLDFGSLDDGDARRSVGRIPRLRDR